MMQLKVAIATLALLFGMSTATFAQFDEPLNQSTSPPSQTFDRPDGDINVDPNNTNQEVETTTTVDMTTTISADLEANRQAELAALKPHFNMMLNEMADVLDPDQASTLQGIAVTMDLFDLAAMDADDQVSLLAELTQRLNLRGSQVESFQEIIAEHVGEMNKLHVTYLEQERLILSRRTTTTTTTTISAPAESTTIIERQETTTEVVPAPAPAPAPAPRSEVRGTQQQQREFIRNQDLK